ncbi:MAG TPA: 50S ribosomal protein L15 [Gemmata sp.]|jgi:large subunit ribosomal protein L15|nr:50S ribosomal protein L15 [Gemmata sp.]
MDLTSVSSGIQKRKLKRRVGRGIGSGQGKTCGLGHKGQYASAGARLPSGLFEGGQMPLYRRFPKRGFSHATWDKDYAIVNVGDLEQFDANATVDMAALKSKRLVVGTFDGLRVLGDGELTKKLTIKADHFSKSAKEKIEKASGTCETLPKPKKPVRNKMGSTKKATIAAAKAKAAKAPKAS